MRIDFRNDAKPCLVRVQHACGKEAEASTVCIRQEGIYTRLIQIRTGRRRLLAYQGFQEVPSRLGTEAFNLYKCHPGKFYRDQFTSNADDRLKKLSQTSQTAARNIVSEVSPCLPLSAEYHIPSQQAKVYFFQSCTCSIIPSKRTRPRTHVVSTLSPGKE